jgi:hypothetical protein
MLTIFGNPHRNGGFCDGVSRRDFLTIGGALLGGLSLPKLLEAETASGGNASHKAIINVFLPGGPPHIDMWDLKPDAPVEIRGEYSRSRRKSPASRFASCSRTWPRSWTSWSSSAPSPIPPVRTTRFSA